MFSIFGGGKNKNSKKEETEEDKKEHARNQRLKKLSSDVPMQD